MSRTHQTFTRGNLQQDPYNDDDNDIQGDSCPWCSNALASLSLFCPITKLPPNKINPSNSKERNYLGTPLPETPIEVRRKRRLLEGLLEAEESMHNFDIFNQHSITDHQGEASQSTVLNMLVTFFSSQTISLMHFVLELFFLQIGEHELAQKYEIGDVLGIGSTSTCHRCIERATGREFACKIIDKTYVESLWDGMLDQFYTEIDVLKSLHHPNIIRLYDVYYTTQKIYIVMELMEGGEWIIFCSNQQLYIVTLYSSTF